MADVMSNDDTVEAWVVGLHQLPADAPMEAVATYATVPAGHVVIRDEDGNWLWMTREAFDGPDGFEWV